VADDPVEAIIEQWARERPDLPLKAMRILGRLGRLEAVAKPMVEDALGRFGLKLGEFDVLATLRRAGPPFQLNPSELAKAMMLSSGAMTNRLDRLEEQGLVARLPDPSDRRGTIVALTDEGRARIDAAVESHVRNEERLLSALSAKEQDQLDAILKKLLAALESVR
jgi:DNA-binding MarR family transcriptional regulator